MLKAVIKERVPVRGKALEGARIPDSPTRRQRKKLRVGQNPVWLGHQGKVVSFGVHETHYLVLAAKNRLPHPQQVFTLEDHRLTANPSLGIESRALESIPTSIEVELTMDCSRTKVLNWTINLKTFRFAPKDQNEKAKTV
jgi:hypothetical protein